MRIVVVVLAQGIAIEDDNTLTIQRGFFEMWNLPTLPPCKATMDFAMVVQVERDEVEKDFTFHIVIENVDSGAEVGNFDVTTRRRGSPQNAPCYAPVACNIGATFEDVGMHRIRVLHEGEKVYEMSFGVGVA